VKPLSIPTHTVSRATLLATSLGLAVVAHAAETTITKADNADALNLGPSWSGGIAPGASDIGLWDNTVSTANATVLGGDLSWAGIRVADPGGAVSIGAGNTLTLGTAGIDMSLASQNLTLANALALGAAQTWNVSVGQSLTVSGSMSGTGGIAKSGPGTLLLGGGNASYSGAVAIHDGAVELTGAAALGTGNTITIGASGSIDPTLVIGVGGVTHALGAIDVPGSVAGARISMPQNNGTRSHTIAGASLASPLTVAQSNTSGSNWSQVTWTSKITGIGGGAGNDTLVFHNTGGTQNYYTTNNGAAHDFSGNVHLKGGLIAVQSQTPNGNLTIPDASMLWVEAGEWRSNNGGMVETIDGLRGAGTMGNPQNLTLTINANNSANDGNRSFSGTLGNMGGALTLGGSGLQEFSGNKVTYTNGTNLNNGTLKLTNVTAWGSSLTMGASNSPKVQLNAPLIADAWDFRKVVSGGSASASLEKTGDGTVTLPAAQTFTGTTVVSGGTLKMQSTDYPTSMPPIPGMRVWLDAADPEGDGNTTVPAEGAGVSTWKNKGTLGATADFLASTSGTNPPTYTSSIAAFNNQPAITFNAATGKMLANSVNYGNSVSVVYVGRIGTTKARLVSGGTQNWILGYHGGNMNTNYWGSNSTGSGAADTNPHIWISGATSGSNILGYRFDGAGETLLPTGSGSVAPTAGLTLGGGWNVTTTPIEKSDGDIAELFVFDHQLTTTERAQLEGYLYNKYFGSQFPSAITSLNATGSVSVAGGATFGGYGSAGSTTVAAGGTILAGNPANGSLTLSGLAFNGAATVVGTPTATAAPLVVNGTLATAGSNSVNLVVPASLTVGTHHLIQYNTLSGSLGDFTFPAPVRSMAIAHNAPYIDVVVSPTVAFPVWTGAGGGEWSYGAGLGNWKLSSDSSTTDFMANDAVLFDDTVGAGSTAISVGVSTISPGVITFNNSSTNFSLTQANGMDINSGSLVKSGTGTLAISGSFTFAGGAALNGGLVSVDSPGSLGTGGRSFNGGTLEYNGATGTMAGTTTLNAGGGTINVTNAESTLTFGGALGGTGALVKTGAGSLLTPLATGTYANAIEIDGGTLGLNYGSNAVILSGPISGSSGVLRLDGTGANATSGLTFTGANTFTGETHIYGRRIFLDRTGGNAINGDIVFKQANWPYHDLSLNQNEQIVDTALLRWEQPAGQDVYEFRLNGKTETVAGLVSTTTSPAIIENAGYDGSNDNNIPAGKLIVNTPSGADYSYSGSLRNQNGGSGNGALSFEKQGPGTQTLIGGFSYTGSTTVSGGKLVLQDSSAPFASSGVTVAAGAALEIRRTTGTGSTAVPIGGAGEVIKSGAGLTTLTGNQSYTGTTTIAEGTLSITGSLASPVIDVQALGGLSTTTVGTGTTVTGSGALVGVTFGSGSTLSPGSTATPIDTPMLGDGTITLTAGSTCAMEVDRTGGIITSDRLEGMDAIVYAGTLTVTATGQAFLAGDVVPLFPGAASYGGGFTTTNLPALGSGLSWDLSKLTIDGSMQVVSFAPTPVFNPPAGGYIGAQTVTISSSAGSTIYYTLDGSTPTLSSPNGPSPVTGVPIPTNSTVTVKAFA
jgi:fibronectin-binding autotransporter adhesin